MSEFAKEDVLILARAILDDPIEFYSPSCGRESYECRYCEQGAYDEKFLKHRLDCPVLVATDIMTGNE